MKNIAIYPGTFDSITFGHIDVIKKGINLFDKLIIAVSEGGDKNHLFTTEERINLVKNSLYNDIKISSKKIQIIKFSSLTTTLCQKYKSKIILRGLRAVSDFEYEFLMTGMNRSIDKDIETIFLMSSEKYHFISSRFIKEIHKLGGDISKSVPKPVLDFLSKIWNVQIFYLGP